MTRMQFTSRYNFDSANRLLSTRDLDQILDTDTDMGAAIVESSAAAVADAIAAGDILSPTDANATYVAQADLVPIYSHKVMHEDVTVNLGGTDWITLGADPVDDSVILWKNGTKLATSSWSLSGRDLTVTGAAFGDVIGIYYLYTGDQTAVAATTPQLLGRHTFTGTDSATTVPAMDVGGAMTVGRGVWGITSNQLYLATPDGSGANDTIYFDSGESDVILQAKIVTVDTVAGPGILSRSTGYDNCWTTNTSALFKREAATNTSQGTFSATFVSGDTIRLRWEGTTCKAYRQAGSTGGFTQVASYTGLTFQSTATAHGIRARSNNTGRADDFICASLS